MLGALVIWQVSRHHFAATSDGNVKQAALCTSPAIRRTGDNLIAEIVGTFVLLYCVLNIVLPSMGLGALDVLPVGLQMLGMGGTTGYAINPARDFGLCLVHALLPIPGKRDSDWGYVLVPVAGSIAGGVAAAWLYGLQIAY
jgi:glycerol uptake facilitator protein